MAITVERREGGAETCVFCRSEGLLIRCEACSSGLHAECWGEVEGCPTLGCEGGPAEGGAAPASVAEDAPTCPACQRSGRAAEMRRCEACGARTHEPCWRELGRCPTPGCGAKTRERAEAAEDAAEAARRQGGLGGCGALTGAMMLAGVHALATFPLGAELCEGVEALGEQGRAEVIGGAALTALVTLIPVVLFTRGSARRGSASEAPHEVAQGILVAGLLIGIIHGFFLFALGQLYCDVPGFPARVAVATVVALVAVGAGLGWLSAGRGQDAP